MAGLLCAILNREAKLSVVDALLLAVIGIVIVFIVLIALMLIVTLVGKIFDNSGKLQEKHPELGQKVNELKGKLMFWKKLEKQEEQSVASESVEEKEKAEGTCGELTLVNTSERDAAMIMAIVADTLETPLNELKFKSIKKIEEDDKQ